MKNLYLLILFLFNVVVFSDQVGAAEPYQIDLQKSENNGYWHPQETLKLSISNQQLKRLNQAIVVELDAIEITAMLDTSKANQASFQPIQPLAAGQHELRVVEYTDEGDINELGYWSIEVRQSEMIQQYQVVANNQISASYRIVEKNIGDPVPQDFQGQAISQVAFTTNSGNWQSSGHFDLYYDSLPTNQINDRPLNNNDFLFSVGNEVIEARLGHQKMAVTSMVMDNFLRRGVSLESRLASINSRVSGFSLSSAQIIGFGNGLGISDSQQRVEGVTFDSSPFVENPRSLYLTGTWLTGESSKLDQFSVNTNSSTSVGSDSEAWAFSGESFLLKNKLRIRAEYAATDYDFDISDNIESDQDDAYSLLVTYNDVIDSRIAWNIGVAAQKVGTFFRSIANRSLPSDKKISKIFAGSQWTSFGIQASVDRQHDNVEDIEFLPRIRTDLANLSFNWSPQVENFDAWYGAPSFALMLNQQSQLQTFTPTDYLFAKIDNDIDSVQINGQFSYQSSSWGLALSRTDFTDHSLLQSNSETVSFDLYGNFVFGEDSSLSVSPVISWNDTLDTTNQITTKSVSYALQAAMMIVPQKLTGSLNVNWNSNQVGNNLLDGDNLAANFAINWSIRQPKVNQFGVNMTLTSSYNDFSDHLITLNSLEVHQTLLSIMVTFPLQAGQANE